MIDSPYVTLLRIKTMTVAITCEPYLIYTYLSARIGTGMPAIPLPEHGVARILVTGVPKCIYIYI